jgi:hypothetical protein
MELEYESFIGKCFKYVVKMLVGSTKRDKPVQLEFNLYHRYILQTNYQKKAYGFFKAGEIVIYLGSGFAHYDGYEAFDFFDIKGGLLREIRLYVDEPPDQLSQEIKKIQKAFVDLGPDMTPGSFSPNAGRAESNYNGLKEHLEYFKDLVEGKEAIKSWFVWLEENTKLLHESLTRADQLRFKCDAYKTIKDILNFFGIPVQENPRYKYLGISRHELSGLPESQPLPLP